MVDSGTLYLVINGGILVITYCIIVCKFHYRSG
jgi:hypothetical protein